MKLPKSKFNKKCEEISAYYRTRGNFIAFNFWKTWSVISVLYVAISVVLSPFVLWGKLSIAIFLHINIIGGSLILIIYGYYFIALLFYSLSKRGRKSFDRRIQYKGNEISLDELQKRINNIEKALDHMRK